MVLTSTWFVQEGSAADARRPELEASLKDAIHHHVHPKARVAILWITVPHGNGYAAGKPSRSTIVQVGVPDGFSQPGREALMRDLNDRVCRITGHAPSELMIGATDQSPGRKMLKTIFGQIPLNQKPRFLMDHLPQVIRSLTAH